MVYSIKRVINSNSMRRERFWCQCLWKHSRYYPTLWVIPIWKSAWVFPVYKIQMPISSALLSPLESISKMDFNNLSPIHYLSPSALIWNPALDIRDHNLAICFWTFASVWWNHSGAGCLFGSITSGGKDLLVKSDTFNGNQKSSVLKLKPSMKLFLA